MGIHTRPKPAPKKSSTSRASKRTPSSKLSRARSLYGSIAGRGFTIVELLIVIIVIGILATLVLVSYGNFTRRSHETVLISDLTQGAKTLEIAKVQNDSYPASLSTSGLQSSQGNTFTYNVSSDGNSYCLQETGFGITYSVSDVNKTAVQGACSGYASPSSGGPVLADTSFVTGSNAASLTVNLPNGATTGSLIILHVFGEWNTSTAGTISGNLNVPGNFTLANSINANEFSNTFQELAGVYYGYVQPGDTSYQVKFNNIGTRKPNDEWVSASLVTGATTSGSPFVDTFKQVVQYNNISNNFTMPSFTPGADNSLIYVAVGDPGNITETTYSTPNGWTKSAGGAGAGYYGTIFYTNQTTAAPTGDVTFKSDRNDGKYVIIGTIRKP